MNETERQPDVWTPENIRTARAKLLVVENEIYVGVSLEPVNLWTVYTPDHKRTSIDRLTIEEMCQWMNEHKARLKEEPICPKCSSVMWHLIDGTWKCPICDR